MIFRAFRRTDTGQWLDVLFTADADTYPADGAAQAADLAAALNVDAALLEHVDGNADPRSGTLLALPVPAPPPPSAEERLAAVESELRAMKDRAAAVVVSDPDAVKVRDAVVGGSR